MVDTRIRWTPAEWELICAFILSKYEIQCTASSEYAAIGVKEVEMAMKIVIDRGRWREHLPTKATKTLFVMHMNNLKKKKRNEELHEQQLKEEQRIKREAVEREERYAQQRMLEANRPMIELMVTEIISRILPNIQQIMSTQAYDIAKLVDQKMVQWLGTEQEKQEIEIAKQAEERINKLCTVRSRPRVAVIGTMPTQSQSLAESYPDIDFIRIDKKLDRATDKTVRQSVQGCTVVLGVGGKMGGNVRDETIESVVGKENYIKVYGAASALKRQVAVCIQSNQIQLAG